MALENYQYDAIIRGYNRRQYHHKHLLDARKAEAYRALPALQQLDEQEADASYTCAKRLFAGKADADARLKEELAAISARRRQLLKAGGFAEDWLELTYDCPLCHDTGFTPDGEKCICFQKAAIALLYEQSNHQAQYEKENFSAFSLDWYADDLIEPITQKSARALAENALAVARRYTAAFTGTAFDSNAPLADSTMSDAKDNLLIYGPTGVGKTFLANCIAKELIETMHSVVHLDAIALFDKLAARQFRQEEDATVDSLFACDLLIIDDLGTELVNSFIINSLGQCIDTRLKNGKGTIITTNLELGDLKARYLDRTFSRLISGYTLVRMAGSDIRLLKQRQ